MAERRGDGAGDGPLLPVRHRGVLVVGVMGAQVMQILDTTIANVALPHMEASLGATVDTISWVLTSYIVATAIALPATGWLADRFGSRNLFLTAVGGFIVASMLCGTAVSLTEMVAFRALQGAFAAFINPLSQTAMIDVTRPRDQAKAMSIWGMGVMVAPIMGPVIGGWLTESYNWRWVFYVNVPVGGVTLAILWFLLPSRPVARRGFDLAGFVLLGVAMASFQLMLDRGEQLEWFASWEIVTYACVFAAAGWMTVVHLATSARPLFDRSLFGNRNLALSMVFMLVIGLATMAPMALLPAMLQQLFGYPVIDTGFLLAPRGVGVLATTFVAGRLMGKVDTRLMIVAGFVIFAASVKMMAGFSLDMDARPIVVTGVIQGAGMGLVFMPLNSLAFATLGARQRTDGASLLNLTRSIGQSAGISMVTTLLARNLQTSHADLAAHLSSATLAVPQLQSLGALGSVGDAVTAMADGIVNQQAGMIAYLDDFYLMAWLAIAAAPLVLLLAKPRRKLEAIIAE